MRLKLEAACPIRRGDECSVEGLFLKAQSGGGQKIKIKESPRRYATEMLRAARWCRERSVAGKEEANRAGIFIIIIICPTQNSAKKKKYKSFSFLSSRRCSRTVLSGCTSLLPIGNLKDPHGLRVDGRAAESTNAIMK